MSAPSELEALVGAVQRDPGTVRTKAEQQLLLLGVTDARGRAVAKWAAGLANRELGDLKAARAALEEAWTLAVEVEERDLAGEIAISLSLVVAYQGELDGALQILAVSEPGLGPRALGRLRTQRGLVLYEHGRFGEALEAYRAGLDTVDGGVDELGEARLRINVAALLSYLGLVDEAREHLLRADQLAASLDQTLLRAVAAQNLAHLDVLDGDFASAFEKFARAAWLFEAGEYVGPLSRALRLDHARALLEANLLSEAADLTDIALSDARRSQNGLDLGTASLLAAEVRLAVGEVGLAAQLADAAAVAFRRLGREAWGAQADSVGLRARATAEVVTPDVVDELDRTIGALTDHGMVREAIRTRVLLVEALLRTGEVDRAHEASRIVMDDVRSTPALQPVALQVRALVDLARGERAAARRAVNLGVRLLTGQQAALGAMELRAQVAANSERLARIGVGLAIADRRPRELLAHLEATRRTTSLLAVSRPPDDEKLVDLLAVLRAVGVERRDADTSPDRQVELTREQRRLEQTIRDHVRRAPPSDARAHIPLTTSIAQLGDRVLVEYANLDGTLHAVSVVGGRSSLHELGPIHTLAGDIESASHMLHRLNRAQGSTRSRAAAMTSLTALTTELAERLLPQRVIRSGRPIVVVPTGMLHALPWGTLPGLIGRPVSVTPSLTAWAVASSQPSGGGRVTLIAGPGLEHAVAEVRALSHVHGDATVLTGAAVTSKNVLAACERSDLSHIACHGTYRVDSPLFSTLQLHDGPMTSYDLERCRSVPRTIVLSACNVALGVPAGGGALLGLANALMTFGTGAVVAPLTPISDERVVPVMARLHAGLRAGHDVATALAATVVDESGSVDPTAAAFIAIGA